GNMANENPSGLGAFTFNPRFPGQYFDRETNLHYNYFRDYSPDIGRYVESDPIGLYAGLNTYSYVKNNPVMWGDPTGLDATVCIYSGAGGFGHVGIGVNSSSTVGLYPMDGGSGNAVSGTPGEVKPDTKDPQGCKTISTSPAQDKKMSEFIKGASTPSIVDYTLAINNCVNFVRMVLQQGGISSPDTIRPVPFFNGLPGSRGRP
ncbi:MAG: RHS repeat-associated core domain-containing protein, partial [Betaproteobacteria bacterium]